MKSFIGILIFVLTFLSCSKQDTQSSPATPKTTGHIYCQLKLGSSGYNYGYSYGYGYGYGNGYYQVNLFTVPSGTGPIASKTTTNANAKLDFGELNPGNYLFRITNYYNYKDINFQVQANVDQVISATW